MFAQKCNVCSEVCTPLHAQCCAMYLVLKWYTGMALYVIDIYLPLISDSGGKHSSMYVTHDKKCENFCVRLYSFHLHKQKSPLNKSKHKIKRERVWLRGRVTTVFKICAV